MGSISIQVVLVGVEEAVKWEIIFFLNSLKHSFFIILKTGTTDAHLVSLALVKIVGPKLQYNLLCLWGDYCWRNISSIFVCLSIFFDQTVLNLDSVI